MKNLFKISVIAVILALPIAAKAQETVPQDTIATFKVENSDDVVLSSENDAVAINIAGYKIQLGNSKDDTDYNATQLSLGLQGTKFRKAVLDEDGFTTKKVKTSKISFASNTKLGLISLSSPNYSAYSADDKNFMDLRGGKSIFFGLDLVGLNIPLNDSGSIYFKSGVNLMCYNYTFSNDVTLKYKDDLITPVAIDSGTKKSKLATTYIAIPLSVSFKLAPKLFLEPGVYAGVLVNAHTKYKKPKVKSGYLRGVNQAVAGASLSLSYDGFGIYCDYNATTLFDEGRGPKTKALTFGLTFKL